MSIGNRRGQNRTPRRPKRRRALSSAILRYGSLPAALFVVALLLRYQIRTFLSSDAVAAVEVDGDGAPENVAPRHRRKSRYGPGNMEDFSGKSRWRQHILDSTGGKEIITDSMRPFVKGRRTSSSERAGEIRRPRKLEPIFHCRPRRADNSNSDATASPIRRHPQRIVFVHVFKTAGSTLREFFADYARRCSAGWAVLIGCTRLDAHSLLGGGRGDDDERDERGGGRGWQGRGSGDGRWFARKAGRSADECVIKRSVAREDGRDDNVTRPVFGAQLAEEFDMFGGHLPLGTGSVWDDVADEGGMPNATLTTGGASVKDGGIKGGLTYVAFFRNAADKYLSGVSFVTKASKPPKAVSQIKAVIPPKLAEGHYQSKFADYLITPQQRMVDRMVSPRHSSRGSPSLSAEEGAIRVMMNLIKFDVLVGLTERMSDSLRVLEVLMDEGGDAADIFDNYGRERDDLNVLAQPSTNASTANTDAAQSAGSGNGNGNGTSTGARKANISKLSTSDLIKALVEETPRLFADVLEYTKYEQQITDFALALHMRQAKSLGIGGGSLR